MLKTLKRIIQENKEKYRIPRNVRDLIPIDTIWKDGIFKRGNLFNQTFVYRELYGLRLLPP